MPTSALTPLLLSLPQAPHSHAMSLLALFFTLFSVGSLASPIAKRQAPSFVFNGDAPFTVDTGTLAAALTCPNGAPTQAAPPVLLVHGTSVYTSCH